MNNTPELSIIIVHCRTPELLKLCLSSLNKALAGHADFTPLPEDHGRKPTATGFTYETIVVDCSTSRTSQDLAKQFHEIKLLPFKENLGYSRGVNVGIKNAKGDYFLILNPDIIVTGGAISKMLQYLKGHPDIGMLGPKMLNFNGSLQHTYFSFYKPITIPARRSFLSRLKPFKKALDEFLMINADPQKIQTPDWLMGSAMMVSRAAQEKVGGMDERFFMYFEDVDWARRFWHNDYKVVYYPEAAMYHYHQRESSSRLGLFDVVVNKKTRWHISSAIKFFLKYRNLANPK